LSPIVVWYGDFTQILFITTTGVQAPTAEGLTFILIVKINPTTSMAKNKERVAMKKGAILEKMRKYRVLCVVHCA